LDDYLKLICFLSTSVYSALGVSAIMRYINRRFTYLLTYLTFDLESGVRVTCDVGYPCANFGLPRPLCSRLRLDVRDRQTDVRQKHCLMPRLLGAGA